ncbi:Csu type fimbrial protein [Rhodanobacter sp. BL-MT-08]
MKFQKTLFAVALLGLTGAVANVYAATTSSSFQVTATVIKSCTISTAPISFGNYDPTSASAVTAQGSVSAKCTKGTPVTVALDQGSNKGGGSTAATPARQMTDGNSNQLPYHIYTTSGGTTEWGNTTATEPSAQTSISVNTALVFTTYGSLPAGTDVPAGNYTDTVTASLVF